MMCGHCEKSVREALEAVPGVASASVDLGSGRATVALAAPDLGLAIGAGTDVAIDAAGAVLVNSRLSDVVAALRLGRATLRNIRENLFWAFVYNVLLIPLAAGALYPLFGWKMHPDLGALAMSLSSLCVVLNALRLNYARLDPRPGAISLDSINRNG